LATFTSNWAGSDLKTPSKEATVTQSISVFKIPHFYEKFHMVNPAASVSKFPWQLDRYTAAVFAHAQ